LSGYRFVRLDLGKIGGFLFRCCTKKNIFCHLPNKIPFSIKVDKSEREAKGFNNSCWRDWMEGEMTAESAIIF